MIVELSGAAQQNQKSGTNDIQEFKFPPKVYSSKDEQMVIIFPLLHKGNKLKLPEVQRPTEVGRTNDPKYYLFHRMVHHPTSLCFILKDKIQVLVDAEVLTLNSEQKKVTANMVTLNFGIFPKMTVQDRLVPVPKAKLDIINPMTEKQKAKGLILTMTEYGEIMRVYPNII